MAKDHEFQKNLVIADTTSRNCSGSPKAAEKATEATKLVLDPLDRNVSTTLCEILDMLMTSLSKD